MESDEKMTGTRKLRNSRTNIGGAPALSQSDDPQPNYGTLPNTPSPFKVAPKSHKVSEGIGVHEES